ncbi:hypothetical protein [Streptomyces sp. NBC_00207]|uniref:hypothetical protein n=1 Tax=Streptomyces sp. NBC_00207 TaxID=2903635 RepID=UPI0028880672|nr:hypothetical protein [Streptomyces sp. DSM 41633]
MVSIINKVLDEGRHVRLSIRAKAIKVIDVMGVVGVVGVECAAARGDVSGERV